jgi:thiamine monophosphate kinase
MGLLGSKLNEVVVDDDVRITNKLGTTATEVKAQAKAEEEAKMAAVLGPRPRTAKGTFLRVLTIYF